MLNERMNDLAQSQHDTENVEARASKLKLFDEKIMSKCILVICAAMALFHIYTAGFGVLETTLQRAVHLTFILTLIFLIYPSKNPSLRIFDYLLSIAGAAMGLYIILSYNSLMVRVGDPNTMDIVFGCILVLIVLEATRRTSGWALVIVSLVALVYVVFGHHLTGMFAHRQYNIVRLINTFYVGGEGLFGSTLGVAATYIVTFVIFGSFLEQSGGTKAFIDLSYALAGQYRGGPAKIAVISSALMGTINGTAVANVVTTGTFSIPLMKKLGYKPETAAAVEAVASSGGAIMPPVMGAGAFVMSAMTGIPYAQIIIGAAIPAVVYYLAVFLSVDFEARKLNMKGIPKEELPRLLPVLKKSFSFFIPLAVMVYFICVAKASVLQSAFNAQLTVVVFNVLFGGEFRMKPQQYLDALVNGAKGTLMVSCACCCVGLVVGTLSLTGAGLMITKLVLQVAGNSLLLALMLVMLTTILMGMALPATPSYIIVSVIACSALVKFDVSLLAAHLFVFYFCAIAPVTPPVCIASYAAAGIAKSDPMKTGLAGMRLGIAGFLCPFMFIFSPGLLAQGSMQEIILACMTASIGTVGLAAFAIGWFGQPLTVLGRALCFVAGGCLVLQGLTTDFIGLAILVVVFLFPDSFSFIKEKRAVNAVV